MRTIRMLRDDTELAAVDDELRRTVSNSPVRDDDGNVIRCYATATDIHDRKRAEGRVRSEHLPLREEIIGSSAPLQVALSQPSVGLVRDESREIREPDRALE